MTAAEPAAPSRVSLVDLVRYFLTLGATGFGGPVALVGYMRRDLAEERGWISHDEFQDGLAIAQTMPGPLAAQLAMWIGFIRYGALGATLTGFAFILPPFLLVAVIGALYVAFDGIPQIRALFYGIGPAAVAIITLSAWKLARTTDGADVKLWVITAVLFVVTVVSRAELAWLFVVAGLIALCIYAPPWRRNAPAGPTLAGLFFPLFQGAPVLAGGTLLALLLFFVKAAAFTFGSGLAIVPFLHEGVVVENGWLTERQFLDAVALGLITPGPVVIMATFVGYLVAGFPGAVVSSLGVFAPVWLFNVILGPLFLRHRTNLQVRGFVKGATAAAVGAIAGASVILGQGAITDVATVLVFLVALPVLYFKKLKEPYVVGLAAVVGLILFRG
jgi:chromate transporter